MDALDEYINTQIEKQAVRELYIESKPQSLSEYMQFYFSLPMFFDAPFWLQFKFNMSRSKARQLNRIIRNMILSGYHPSIKPRYSIP